ncbi:unnamed protein product [Vitrella brassicaformis CCMP3155]|uniref:Uncharacterized protein n=1 Tax=Vitrella brassicaformis (strain CCMP3155) TaxID=1169540 RepID=A0A0G4GE56_VITBC|nr:unnamed protein product [Vitrella brassicaformis CCMP3155]|eukprot:CEM27679.1 unnamed protein product [Vitrella brassicaformis CCMP3155]
MDVNQFVANARTVKDSLALHLDQDPATIAAQASSPVGLALSYQLGSVACLLDTLPPKLQQREPSLASAVAVDAPTSTTDAAAAAASGAAHTEPQAPVASGPSYRLIHRRGNPPPVNNQGPARRRLSRDELANVFGHLQPWELTRHRRRLGTPLFHQSAANYTHLVIDCEDDTARRMWETMPLAVAQRWGERATNVREIKHRYPTRWRGEWCRGTWVALFVANARTVKDSLALHLDQDPATIAAQASSPVGLALSYQLGSVACLLDTLPPKLQQREPSLASAVAVDAPTSTTDAAAAAASGAAHTEPQAPVASGPSYRLIHRRGNPPPVNNQGPARRRLSRDELANVFGHLQPWELTRHRRRLGTPLFHQSAANYTHLVIDCEDDTARRMWETMPLAVAQRWGERATNVREIKHRYPTRWRGEWCRGTWVALVEGHSNGRKAIAEKKRQEREGAQGTADAAAMAQDDNGSHSPDEGTLEVLAFEHVELDDSVDIPDPRPSYRLPPAPAAPVHLPALKTVDNIPNPFLSARVGRQWRTPAVKSLTTQRLWLPSVEGARSWVAGEAIEVLDLADVLDADEVAGVLSGLPADGQSLAALRTLRGVWMDESSLAGIDRLREVMVARGVSRSIRELEIDMGWMWDETVERSQRVARLIDAIAHPEAVQKGVLKLHNNGCGRIDAELLSRSSTGPAAAQQLIRDFAKRAGTVTYRGGDETHRVAATADTFPAAHTLLLFDGALANEGNVRRAVEIASHMPRLSCVDIGDLEFGLQLDAPAGEVWRFLERLQAALVSRGKERSLSVVYWYLSASAVAEPVHTDQSPCLWGRRTNGNLPPVEEVTITVLDGVQDDQFEKFCDNIMATITSFTDELKGHKKAYVRLWDDDLCTDFQRRFMAQQAGISLLNSGPYKLSLDADGLWVERRSAAT